MKNSRYKSYDVELPDDDIGRSRYSEIRQRHGLYFNTIAISPAKAVTNVIMKYCKDDRREGQVILHILGKREGGLESFATEVATPPKPIPAVPIRRAPDGKEYVNRQLRLF